MNDKVVLKAEKASALVEHQKQAICQQLPDKVSITGAEINDRARSVRKIVYMDDTCSGDMIKHISHDCDILIHEATNAFF